MKTLLLNIFLLLTSILLAQERDTATLQQEKDSVAKYNAIIQQYKGENLASLPESNKNELIMAKAKKTRIEQGFGITSWNIQKHREMFATTGGEKHLPGFEGDKIYWVKFPIKDTLKKDNTSFSTIGVVEKNGDVLIRIVPSEVKVD